MTDTVQRWDLVELPRPRKDGNKYLVAPQTHIARTGPQTYTNADGSTRIELRLPEDVGEREALDSLSALPVTIGHPDEVTPENAQDLVVGSTGRADLRGDLVEADLKLWADRGIRAAQSGHNELSVGYSLALEPVPGGVFRRSGHRYDGTRADFLQRQIRANHLGLVKRGRANQGRSDRPVRLRLDADGNQDSPGVEAQEETMSTTKLTVNGQTFDADPALAAAYQAEAATRTGTQTRTDADDGKLAALEARIAQAEARADAADAALEAEKAKAKDEDAIAAKKAETKAHMALVLKVSKLTKDEAPELFDLDTEALHAKAIEKLSPGINLDGKSAAYKEALFDHLSTQEPDKGTEGKGRKDSATDIQKALGGGKKATNEDQTSPLAAAALAANKSFYSLPGGSNSKAQ